MKLFLTIFSAAVLIFLILLVIGRIRRILSLHGDGGATANGFAEEIQKMTNSGITYYRPVIRYEVNGKKYVNKNAFYSPFEAEYAEGQQFEIRYLKSKPEFSFVRREWGLVELVANPYSYVWLILVLIAIYSLVVVSIWAESKTVRDYYFYGMLLFFLTAALAVECTNRLRYKLSSVAKGRIILTAEYKKSQHVVAEYTVDGVTYRTGETIIPEKFKDKYMNIGDIADIKYSAEKPKKSAIFADNVRLNVKGEFGTTEIVCVIIFMIMLIIQLFMI